MKDKDAKAKEPDWDDYAPNIEKYQKQETDDWGYSYTTTDYDAYQAAYDEAQEKYDKAYSDYQAALDRNNLREDLKADSNYKSYSLYNESGEKLASDLSYPSIMQISNLPNGTDSAGFTEYVNFSVYDTSIDSMKKVDITKISDSENISTKISEQITMHNVIYNGSKIISIEKEGYYCSTVNYDPDSSKFVVTFAKNYDSNSDDSSWDSISIYSFLKRQKVCPMPKQLPKTSMFASMQTANLCLLTDSATIQTTKARSISRTRKLKMPHRLIFIMTQMKKTHIIMQPITAKRPVNVIFIIFKRQHRKSCRRCYKLVIRQIQRQILRNHRL